MTTLTDQPQWQKLSELAASVKQAHMRDWFAEDSQRAQSMQAKACGIFLDYSKNRVTDEVLTTLFDLARAQGLETARERMFSGEPVNHTEQRAVLHTALRNLSGEPVQVEGEDVMPEIQATLEKMREFTEAVHNQTHVGYTGKPVKDIVAIGIGGSFLGPKIMTEALKPYRTDKVKVHFVANVDGCHIHDVLSQVNHEETLIVMSSKSFSTQETLQNTQSAKQWFLKAGGSQADIARHFVAVSSNVKAATEFGIDKDNVFPMWDWVGGRYSLWSAIGLPICLALGYDNFHRLLKGAHQMDEHFRSAPLKNNLPVILGMLGVWYRNFFNAQSHVLLPYYHYLRGLPAYVQQLDMESNGKRTNDSGDTVNYQTGPIIWGSEGTNGQHSFHQLIHQGTSVIPADFLLPLKVPNQNDTHHAMLASNCFGQSQALMQGKTYDECYADLADETDVQRRSKLAAHKTMPGNKPSNTLLFEQLDPETLGSLVALYEHKVFVQGVIWEVNSFDQWGVELGKQLGNEVLNGIQGNADASQFDDSTLQLIKQFTQAN
ncbi:glucose-6-phosphate isomerase [Salinimonas marina]|uniref:Glucose-6-phosphate isomerase n=1 Tax=Salinimonas marina TaxID=2785918 RepID=A0A7S9HDI9_9ALTE|nr:glucose-6-phosphate isomerase [Salinimonas marina]QPG06260.1 glucose-6-phosphate isomerase [Salinimonas marina]